MGIIYATGPQYKQVYNINIAGDVPTEAEQGRIDQYIAQQEAELAKKYGSANRESIEEVAPVEAVEEDLDQTAFMRAATRRPLQREESLSYSQRMLIENAPNLAGILGLTRDDLEDIKQKEEEAKTELARLNQIEASVGFQDIKDVGTAASFAGEAIGSEAEDFAIQSAATVAGLAAAPLFGPLAPIAPIVTRAGGVAYTTVRALPEMFAEALKYQEQAGGDISIPKAAISTAINAATEAVVDYFLVSKLIKPADGGKIRRALVEGGRGAGLEGVTEVQQTMVNRFQAGLPLANDEAKQEYAAAFAGGAVVGKAIGATTGVLGGKRDRDAELDDKKAKELDADIKEDREESEARLGFASETAKQLDASRQVVEKEAIKTEEPEDRTVKPVPEVTTDDEFKDKSFGKPEYDRVLQQIKSNALRDKTLKISNLQKEVKKDLPNITSDQINDITNEAVNRGFVTKRVPDQLTPTSKLNEATKTPEAGYRRQIDIANEAIQKNKELIENYKLDLDAIAEYGRDLQGKRTSPAAVNAEIQRLTERNKQLDNVSKEALAGLGRVSRVPYEPKAYVPKIPSVKRENKLAAVKARSVADKVQEKVQSNLPLFNSQFTEKQEQVFKDMSKRLESYGMKDVRLGVEQVVDSQVDLDTGNFVSGAEGSYNPTTRMISLSVGLYDPKLSDADYNQRIGEVLDHEAIHALRSMNVIKPEEYKSFEKSAGNLKYARVKDGKSQKRSYTYLDRAKRMYSDQSSEIQMEEAIAEMFRDYNAGRLKIAGRPRGLFEKIKNFFKSIVGASVDNGFDDTSKIFDQIVSGEVGRRQRPDVTDSETLSSRLALKKDIMPQFATEEEYRDEKDITMPIDANAPNDQVRSQINKLTKQNVQIVKKLIERIDKKFGTKSGDNIKDLSKVTQKAKRPSILAKKPWYNVSHIRDSYRFKTVIDDFRDVPSIFDELLAEGIDLVKIDTNKLFEPKEWGWRIIAFDLRMPNGQLVEWYIPLKELEIEKKKRGHALFEEWRNKTREELLKEKDSYFKAIAKSYRNYQDAFNSAVQRINLSPEEAEASWRSAESSLLEAARNSRRSSGVNTSSGSVIAEDGKMSPFKVRTVVDPSSKNIKARDVPSSTKAKGSDIFSTSDDNIIQFNDKRQSRLTLSLSKEQIDNSILPYLDPDTGQPRKKSKPNSITKEDFINELMARRTGRQYDVINSEEDRQEVAEIMAAEAEAALISSPDAIGWYDTALKQAKKTLFPLYPEISPVRPDGTANQIYDPEAEAVYDFITAVTSNGMSVVKNYDFTAELYDGYKNSQFGTIPVKGTGKQGNSMTDAFKFWNRMSEEGATPLDIEKILLQKMKRGDVNQFMTQVLGVERVKDLPKAFRTDSKELADTEVAVAIILGPKIGNGFYRNLKGDFEPLTMDLWWMRFFNRITGRPYTEVSPELVEKNKDDLWARISSNELSELEQNILNQSAENLGITQIEYDDIDILTPELDKVWNNNFYKKAYMDEIELMQSEGGLDFTVSGGTIRGKDREVAKSRAEEARPEKPELSLRAANYLNKIQPELQADPRSAQDRSAMRKATNIARDILSRDLGVNLTNADFQALMWYAEKRIFRDGGVRKGTGDDNDYVDGAIALLKSRGITNDKIEATLPDSERFRVSPDAIDRPRDEQDGKVSSKPVPPKPKEFFAGRELDLLEPDEVDPDTAEVTAVTSQMDVEPDFTEARQSRLTVGDQPFLMKKRPVKGEANPIYGKVIDGGKEVPVVLPDGMHAVYESGIEVGFGLNHIEKRNHDLELYENSKYKRVENAIFDMLLRWEQQGYDDGESVIGYGNRDGIVLEWRNNIPFSAPPMRLVLQKGADFAKELPQPPVKNAFYVKTFFPILTKKQRKTNAKSGKALFNEMMPDVRVQHSRMMSQIPLTQNTSGFGKADTEARMQQLRYAGASGVISRVVGSAGKVFNKDKQIQQATEDFLSKVQDKMLSVGKMTDELRKRGVDIPRDYDAYFQELLMHGKTGADKTRFNEQEYEPIITTVAKMNVPKQDVNKLKKESGYFRQILEKNGNASHALANAYLYAKHAPERNKRILELSKGAVKDGSGMSDAEAQAILSYANGASSDIQQSLISINNGVRSLISKTNDVYIDGGLIPDYKNDPDIDDDTREAFEKFQDYVPLRGFADPEADLDLSDNGTTVYDSRGKMSKPNLTMLGRGSYAGDIINNIGVQRYSGIDKAEKNKVGQALLNLLEKEPEQTKEFAYILSEHPLKRVMKNGRITSMPDRSFYNSNLPVMAVRRGGKEFLIAFPDRRVGDAMVSVASPEQVNSFVRGVHTLTRTYANLVTSWNPAFVLGNLPRDIETAIINSRQYGIQGSAKDIINPKRLGKAANAVRLELVKGDKSKGDPYWRNRYRQFYENGGKNSLNQMSDLAENQKNIEGTINDIIAADAKGQAATVKRLMTSPIKGVKSLFGYAELMNDMAENSVRLSFFDAVMVQLEKEGVPTDRAAKEAAAAARQLTTNFAKGGTRKTLLNSLYLFFNASMQGTFGVINGLVNSPKARQLLAGLMAAGFTQEMLNGLVFAEDEDDDGITDYDTLKEWEKESNIIFPDINKDGTFVKIPMAYGLNIFYNAGRVAGEQLRRGVFGQEGLPTPQQAAGGVLSQVVTTLNPIGGHNVLTFFAPTALDLPAEIYTNKDFTGGNIYKELSPFQQQNSRSGLYWNTTRPSSVAISKFINDTIGGGSDIRPGTVLGYRLDVQPDVIDHSIDFILGGTGKFVIGVGETAYRGFNDPLEMVTKDTIRKTPVVNKLLTTVTEADRVGDYYEMRGKVLSVRADFRDAAQSRDIERLQSIRERFPEILKIMEPINDIDFSIKRLNKKKRDVRKNKSLSDEAKERIIDNIDKQIERLALRGKRLMLR